MAITSRARAGSFPNALSSRHIAASILYQYVVEMAGGLAAWDAAKLLVVPEA